MSEGSVWRKSFRLEYLLRKTMRIEVEPLGACRRILSIEVPAEEVSKEFGKATAHIARQAKIKGFRPGKAPKELIARTYRKQILEGVEQELVPKAYKAALDQEKLEVLGVVEMEPLEIKDGNPITLRITVDVSPPFELPIFKGLTLTRQVEVLSSEDVDREIEHLRERMAIVQLVGEGGLENGDIAQVAYRGTLDGVLLSEVNPDFEAISHKESGWVVTSEPMALPALNEALIGMSAGDTKEIDILIADDFMIEGLRGRTVHYTITVKEIRRRVLPALDESFFSRLGVESEEELRALLEKRMSDFHRQQSEEALREQMKQMLLSSVDYELPQSVVEREKSRLLEAMVSNAMRRGATEEQIREQSNEVLEMAGKTAETNVKYHLLLDRIASDQEIVTTKEEFDAEIATIAKGARLEEAEVRRRIAANQSYGEVISSVRRRKTVEFLMEHATISE